MELRKLRASSPKVGGTLHVAIPPECLEAFELKAGDYVEIRLMSKGILITPAFAKKEKTPAMTGVKINKED